MKEEKPDIYKLSLLLDFYGQLLTKGQFDALDLHCNSDLSMSEIADELGISRQGAYDFINKGRQRLTDFEDKLKLAERFTNNKIKLLEVKELLQSDKKEEALTKLDGVINNGI